MEPTAAGEVREPAIQEGWLPSKVTSTVPGLSFWVRGKLLRGAYQKPAARGPREFQVMLHDFGLCVMVRAVDGPESERAFAERVNKLLAGKDYRNPGGQVEADFKNEIADVGFFHTVSLGAWGDALILDMQKVVREAK